VPAGGAAASEAFPCLVRKADIRLHEEGNSNLPWCKAGLLRHLVDVVDSDQQVVDKELSL